MDHGARAVRVVGVGALHQRFALIALLCTPMQAFGELPDRGRSLRKDILIAVLPVLHLTLGLVLGNTVIFLDFTYQVIPFPGDPVKMIIGKFAPLLFDVALDLFPVAFDAIPVHFHFLKIA